MLPIQVALVRYDERVKVKESELLTVAAALQTQVVRDLTPIWQVPATLCAFSTLADVPPGWVPLVLTEPQEGVEDYPEGFHMTAAGQPLALVQYSDGWPFRASHELIELIVDPYGHRTAPGPSLADENPNYEGEKQGQVEYLVEVCDPCQSTHYEINGIPVSDFVTPHYYVHPRVSGGRYSYTGAVTEPLQILEAGYVSWLTRLPEAQIFQAFATGEGDPPSISNYAGVPPVPPFTRHWVDHHPVDAQRHVALPGPAASRAQFPYAPGPEARKYGEALAAAIRAIELQYTSAKPPPTLEAVKELLQKLSTDQSFYDRFKENPSGQLAGLGIQPPIAFSPPEGKWPSQEEYGKFLQRLEQGERFGEYFGDPLEASALSILAILAR